jgi:hypothetical protein
LSAITIVHDAENGRPAVLGIIQTTIGKEKII